MMRFSSFYSLLVEDKLTDELAKSSLTDDQKGKVKEINSRLSNKTKYISWLVKNVADLPDNTDELLNWFQSRNDLQDKDITHYDVAKLQDLYNEKSDTKSQERKRIQTTTDDNGAELVLKKDQITVWKVKSAEWLRKNFSNTGWCIASSDYKKWYEEYTTEAGLTFYVIHDDSVERYSQYTKAGCVVSDICVGVTSEGESDENARQTADNKDMGPIGLALYLDKIGVDPNKIGLTEVKDAYSEFWKKAMEFSGGVKIIKGRRVVKGDINIPPNFVLTSLKDLGVDRVDGVFNCNRCAGLTSLEGCPTQVESFSCEDCVKLSSLKYCPTHVKNSFICEGCTSLTSLEHCPTSVGSAFTCTGCTGLSSLEHCPSTIGWSFTCSGCTSLTSLKGCPETVPGSFDCNHCVKLSSLEHCPKTVVRDFCCRDCGVKFTENDVWSRCAVEMGIYT